MKYIDQVCEKIVSPLKLRYSPYDLGSPLNGHSKRQDFTVLNLNGFKLQISFYQPHQQNNEICIIYLHSMNGSRLESLVYVEEVLKMGLNFCSFDFSGCGNSEGNSISFGANEKNDILVVVQSLRQKFGIQKVILWGRSMGSACAVKYCQMIQQSPHYPGRVAVIGMILDSCFSSFSKLAVQIGHKNSQIPEWLVKAGYYIIKGTLEEKGKFKVDDLELEDFINTLNLPAMFLTSRQDTTVSCEHSKVLYDLYRHPFKKLSFINGLHNESRDLEYQREVRQFITEVIQQDQNKLNFEKYSDFRANRFERIMEKNRNFVFQSNESQNQVEGCYCSLLPSHNSLSTKHEELILTKRQRTEQPAMEKMRLNKWSQGSPKAFRSTKCIPTRHFP